jgi:hypothetical protein
MQYYYLRGREVERANNLVEWAAWFGSCDRRVAKTKVCSVTVSTVFIGIDFGHFSSDDPRLFETMIFGDSDLEGWINQYRTYEEAIAGHEAAVKLVKRITSE